MPFGGPEAYTTHPLASTHPCRRTYTSTTGSPSTSGPLAVVRWQKRPPGTHATATAREGDEDASACATTHATKTAADKHQLKYLVQLLPVERPGCRAYQWCSASKNVSQAARTSRNSLSNGDHPGLLAIDDEGACRSGGTGVDSICSLIRPLVSPSQSVNTGVQRWMQIPKLKPLPMAATKPLVPVAAAFHPTGTGTGAPTGCCSRQACAHASPHPDRSTRSPVASGTGAANGCRQIMILPHSRSTACDARDRRTDQQSIAVTTGRVHPWQQERKDTKRPIDCIA